MSPKVDLAVFPGSVALGTEAEIERFVVAFGDAAGAAAMERRVLLPQAGEAAFHLQFAGTHPPEDVLAKEQ